VQIAAVKEETHTLELATTLVNDYPLGSICSVANRFDLDVQSPDFTPESFVNLSLAPGARFVSDIVDDVANAGKECSKLICVAPAPGAADLPTGSVQLSGGRDPVEVPLTIYTGYLADADLFQMGGGSDRFGLATLESVPEVSLISLPDIVQRRDLSLDERALAQSLALAHCQKLGERFVLLDVPLDMALAEVHDWPARFAGANSARFGALYFPALSFAIEGNTHILAASPAVAGLIARSDRQDGVGRAPANLLLKGAVKAELDLDASAQAELNLVGVNCIRKFEVGALRLWAARTLSREPEQLYVHHRRVVLLTLKTLSTGLRWAVFEPNDRTLRRRIKDSLEGFLRSLLARGLTAGQSPEEAFYVKIDDSQNGSEIQDAGQVVAEIGIALSKPAEFIVIAVKRSPDMLTLVEEEA
jgi:hypothetical protein